MLSVCCFIVTMGQSQKPGLITKEGKYFYQNGREITSEDLKQELTSVPEAAEEYEKFKSNSNVGMGFMVVGTTCALIGAVVQLSSTAKQAQDLNSGNMPSENSSGGGLGLAVGGLGIVLLGIPFIASGNSHLKKSITLYNGKSKQSTHYKPTLRMTMTTCSVGLQLKF